MPNTRRLTIDPQLVTELLDRLDAEERAGGVRRMLRRQHEQRFRYRVPDVLVEVQVSREERVPYVGVARNLGRDGVSLLVGNLVHAGCVCTVHLITIRNNSQAVTGKVVGCRYLEGSACGHLIEIQFDRPIDPASFAAGAIRSRVLVVDDSPMARKLLSHLLSGLNAEVDVAANGVEALERATSENYDLIMMDIEMPELDGLTATQMLRSKGYTRAIVAISSLPEGEQRDRCLHGGFDDFLPKPPRQDSLAEIIERSKPEPLVSALLHDPSMAGLIDEFVRDLPARVTLIETALAREDLDALGVELRKLKGEAGGFGFEPLASAATLLEHALSTGGELPGLRRAVADVIRLCLSARPATYSPTTWTAGAAAT